jgi:hypothetical protein
MRAAGAGMRAVGWSLRCYPAWWRDRYGAEQEELAEELAGEGRRPWVMAAGLLAGSARARLTGSGMPAVPALWSARARVSVVASTIPAALALPAELTCVIAVGEHGRSDGAGAALSGAGTAVQWELTILLLLWLVCAVQLLAAGSHLAARLLALNTGRRLKAAAFVAAPIAAVVFGAGMIVLSNSLRPVVGSWDKNLVTGVTHYHYLRPGNPVAAAALQWGGRAVAAGGWAAGLLGLGRATARCNLPATALQVAVFNARTTALTQGSFVLSLIALEVTMALQTPIGPHGGLIWASRLGPLAAPVLVILAAIAALSVSGAASARAASGRSRRALSGRL